MELCLKIAILYQTVGPMEVLCSAALHWMKVFSRKEICLTQDGQFFLTHQKWQTGSFIDCGNLTKNYWRCNDLLNEWYLFISQRSVHKAFKVEEMKTEINNRLKALEKRMESKCNNFTREVWSQRFKKFDSTSNSSTFVVSLSIGIPSVA